MIVIGASIGGAAAVKEIISRLPASFSVPIALVLHRHRDSDDALLDILQRSCLLPLREPFDKEPILPGHIYVAPPDYHLLIEPMHFALSVDEPVQYARPSIDVLFESAADALGNEIIAVVLSGANRDGAKGAAEIRRRGGLLIAQDPSTADGPVMPEAAIAEAGANYICQLDEIAGLLQRLTAERSRFAR